MKLEARLEEILRVDPVVWPAIETGATLNLPDCWIVSGAIYNTVWNHLTGRPAGYGLKDIDLFYFDPDTSWKAEDAVIQRCTPLFTGPVPVEIRNQARVHLWYEKHFGRPIPPLRNCRHAISEFAARTHSVGVRLNDGLEVFAPHGLQMIFDMRVVPNTANPNRATHRAKSSRALATWPELRIEPWPGDPELSQATDTANWLAVHDLLRRAFAYMDGRIDPPSSLHRLDTAGLTAKAQDETCYLAHLDGQLAGCIFCMCHADRLYVGKLAVEPALHSRGIGTLMMAQAEALARAKGITMLELETRIELTENKAAFERMGFVETGTTAHPGYDRPTSRTMVKSL
ncbi:MAG: nucleotidyltransferase family protein [Pseudomonadota bacterium]